MATKTKELQLSIPDYLTIGQYMETKKYNGESNWERAVHVIAAITGTDVEEVKLWTVESITKVYKHIQDVANPGQEFHSILEWNGQMYGYAHVKSFSLGEYIDLENLCKDLDNNLHKVAAILYRPITKHRFNGLKFLVKQSIKVANKSGVENVFDYYDIEKYSSETRKEREIQFKEFPVSIILGALSFFLSTASLYLTNIAYSEGRLKEKTAKRTEKTLLTSLSQSIGVGGGLSTHSVNPIYYQLMDQKVS